MKRSRTFVETTSSVPRARRFVSDLLVALPQEVGAMASLLVSELATNAVVHATSPFNVTVVYPTAAGRVRVEVADSDHSQPAPLHPPATAPHGRGLLLVSTLADEWGVIQHSGRDGKAVWFELALPTAPAGEAGSGRSRATRRSTRDRPSFFGLPWSRTRERRFSLA